MFLYINAILVSQVSMKFSISMIKKINNYEQCKFLMITELIAQDDLIDFINLATHQNWIANVTQIPD